MGHGDELRTIQTELKGLKTAVSTMWRRIKAALPFVFTRGVDTSQLQEQLTIHKILSTYFDIEELAQLAFEVGIDVETLGHEPNNRDSLARALIARAFNEGRLARLVAAARAERPFVDWG